MDFVYELAKQQVITRRRRRLIWPTLLVLILASCLVFQPKIALAPDFGLGLNSRFAASSFGVGRHFSNLPVITYI
ncbi:MAG: hypothetical protein K0R22_3545 [Sporomusa sp.]|nr:hypothetical protein [Sporomusa sp.]